MSHRFKVGDRVRKVVGAGAPYVGIVTRVNNNGIWGDIVEGCVKGFTPGENFGCATDYYELVEPAHNCDQKPIAGRCLECLVKLANDGQVAKEELRNFTGQVEFLTVFGDWDLIAETKLPPDKYRIKPKPAFEPFYVGPVGNYAKYPDADPGYVGNVTRGQWLVKLEGDTLHVGCQSFGAKDVKEALKMFNAGATEYNSFRITRHGIYTTGLPKHYISWPDADRILQSLEKAGF